MKLTPFAPKPIALCALLVLPLAACSSTGNRWATSSSSVPDGLLQYADEGDLDKVQDARTEHDQAQDRLAAAKQARTDAEQERRVLAEEIDVAEQRVEVAKARVRAQKDGDTEAMEDAERQVEEAEARVIEANAKRDLHASRIAVERAEIAVAEAEVALAAARVDLAKARAVADLDRPEAKKITVDAFEADVRERETELEIATVKRDAAQREYDLHAEARDMDDDDDDDDDSVVGDDERAVRPVNDDEKRRRIE